MAWSSGHTHEATMSVPATADGALTDYTLLLTEADFNAADHDALADAFAADDVECAEDSAGVSQLAIDVIDVDTTADTFILRVGPVDTSAVSALDLYWRYGSTAVSQTGSAAYDSGWAGYWPDGGGTDRTGNALDLATNGGVTIGGGTGKVGSATQYDGVDDYTESATDVGGIPTVSMIGWVFRRETDDGGYAAIGTSSTSGDRFPGVRLDALSELRAVSGDSLNYAYRNSSTSSLPLNTWEHVAANITADVHPDVYIAGALDNGSTGDGGSTFANLHTGHYFLGAGIKGPAFVDINQWSYHTTSRSAAWIATEHDRSNTLGQATTPAFSSLSGGVSGTGAVEAPSAAASGTGIRTVDGTGAVSAPAASVSGQGTRTVSGTGAVTTSVPEVSGAGSVVVVISGSGSVVAPASTASGSGTRTVSGSGAVAAPAATVSGSGTRTVSGTGSVTTSVPEVSGAGSVGEAISGSGDVSAPAATATGSGVRTVSGTASVITSIPTVAGQGVRTVTGSGGVTAAVATVTGSDETEPILKSSSQFEAMAAASRSAHEVYFARDVKLDEPGQAQVITKAVVGKSRAITRVDDDGRRRREIVRMCRFTQRTSVRHDAFVTIDGEQWSINEVFDRVGSGLQVELQRIRAHQVSRTGYRGKG
jgi:hypothetical protein